MGAMNTSRSIVEEGLLGRIFLTCQLSNDLTNKDNKINHKRKKAKLKGKED
jgi:hypothetical protein